MSAGVPGPYLTADTHYRLSGFRGESVDQLGNRQQKQRSGRVVMKTFASPCSTNLKPSLHDFL
jgi:hypothetical protein